MRWCEQNASKSYLLYQIGFVYGTGTISVDARFPWDSTRSNDEATGDDISVVASLDWLQFLNTGSAGYRSIKISRILLIDIFIYNDSLFSI
jgi:hypothetical protein